jgi:hypothetical protein
MYQETVMRLHVVFQFEFLENLSMQLLGMKVFGNDQNAKLLAIR